MTTTFPAWSPEAAPDRLPAYARTGLPAGARLVITDELRLLIAYASTAVPDGHVIVVSGESGLGKTTMAGAVEAVATVLGLERREVHPTPGEGPIDGECPVNLVLGAPRPLTEAARAALSVNFAFGGANAALVFTRADRPPAA